jgi:hypothetical protein
VRVKEIVNRLDSKKNLHSPSTPESVVAAVAAVGGTVAPIDMPLPGQPASGAASAKAKGTAKAKKAAEKAAAKAAASAAEAAPDS